MKLKTQLSSEEILSGISSMLTPAEKTSDEAIEIYVQTNSFDRSRLPPPDSHILYLNGLPIGSRGNIVSITGKAKSRKTVMASAVATSCFLEDIDFLGFTADLGPDETVLMIDTEQGYYHFYHQVDRILRGANIANGVPRNFHAVRTRDATYKFRIELVEYLVKKLKPAVVILDGISDFVSNINDHDEATYVGEKLLSWSEQGNLLLIDVIHTTKTTGYMTGALGTHLEKKSQTVILVEKPEDEDQQHISHVRCQYARDMPFKSFSIEFSEEKGQYITLDASRVLVPGKGGDTSPEAIADEQHLQVITRAFTHRTALEDSEILSQLKRSIFSILQFSPKLPQLKRYLNYYNNRGLLFQNPELAWMRPPAGTTSNHTAEGLQTGLFEQSPGDGSAPTDTDFTTTDDLPF